MTQRVKETKKHKIVYVQKKPPPFGLTTKIGGRIVNLVYKDYNGAMLMGKDPRFSNFGWRRINPDFNSLGNPVPYKIEVGHDNTVEVYGSWTVDEKDLDKVQKLLEEQIDLRIKGISIAKYLYATFNSFDKIEKEPLTYNVEFYCRVPLNKQQTKTLEKLIKLDKEDAERRKKEIAEAKAAKAKRQAEVNKQVAERKKREKEALERQKKKNEALIALSDLIEKAAEEGFKVQIVEA